MRPVLLTLSNHPRFRPQLALTGSHADPRFGRTGSEARAAFRVDALVPWRGRENSAQEAVRGMSRALSGFASAFTRLAPDLTLVLGDRSDILPAAAAAATLGIPVAQLHGGDTSGTFLDNAYRGAIAAFASLHLPATAAGAKKLAAAGVPRERIVVVGAPGIDAIRLAPRLTSFAVRETLGFPREARYLVVIQHAVLGQEHLALPQAQATFRAVLESRLHALFVYPNADPGARAVIGALERLRKNPRVAIRKNLSHDLFVNLLRHATALVGNSSSGVIEAPFLKLPVVNIGTRQAGRERAKNILDVPHDARAIREAIHRAAYDLSFLRQVQRCKNPYGSGHAAEKVVQALERFFSERES